MTADDTTTPTLGELLAASEPAPDVLHDLVVGPPPGDLPVLVYVVSPWWREFWHTPTTPTTDCGLPTQPWGWWCDQFQADLSGFTACPTCYPEVST